VKYTTDTVRNSEYETGQIG